MKSVYLIGSLRNPRIPEIASELRSAGFDVFDDWYAAGPEADDHWKAYSVARGQSYREALNGYAARHVFEFDKSHLDRCDIGVLVMPAGKSGHLELGYMTGQGKPTHILFDGEPELDRWDVMTQFASGGVHYSLDELIEALKERTSNESMLDLYRQMIHKGGVDPWLVRYPGDRFDINQGVIGKWE